MVQTRDIVVVGASMGGLDALSKLAASLPADFPACILVVQHSAPRSPALIAEILSSRGPLPAVTAQDGMPLERGRIFVAPPDRHLVVTPDGIGVLFGARENRSRPAIDPLFRTAGVLYGSRVTGVILTGTLDDGASGLLAVYRCGGRTIVQSPADAAFPEMPQNALRAVPAAMQVDLAQLGAALTTIVAEPAPPSPQVPGVLRMEAELTLGARGSDDWHQIPGSATGYTCPDCRGSLKQIDEGGIIRYRCRVGHAYSYREMLREKEQSVEQALWVAMQTLEERAQMLDGLASRGEVETLEGSEFAAQSLATRSHIGRLRELLENMAR